MKRFECLQAIAPLIKDELFVTTAGGATAEWNAVRPGDCNIQVKTLGLCSSIGLGLASAIGAAVARPDRLTVAALGDGGAMMALPELETVPAP